MMQLFGADSCIACKQAMTLLNEQTSLAWEYVDVAAINFEGEIPRLVLDDGRNIIGLGPINKFIQGMNG